MEEKVLIKSEFNTSLKKILILTPLILILASAILFILLGFDYQLRYCGFSGFYLAFHSWHDHQAAFLAMFILACIFAVAGIIMFIMYLAHSQCELTITESNVKGKTLFGKRVVLPIHMISAYSTKRIFSTITVATASGIAKFSLIENYIEIGDVLKKIINERQEKTTNKISSTEKPNTSLDELVKLKSLLDAGIITQEEFDAKKKQLLGL